MTHFPRLTSHLWDWFGRLLGRAPEVRAQIARALDLERRRMSDQQAAWVQEYLEHGEWELALSQLRDTLTDLDLTPCDEAAARMATAARLLGQNPP